MVWDSSGQDGADLGVFARRFSSAGAALTGEFQVNLRTFDRQSDAVGGNGRRRRLPGDLDQRLQDGSLDGIFARRFSSTGTALAVEFQVNTYTPNRQKTSRVAHLADDTFVIAWQSENQDGSGYGIFARRFTSTGVGLSPEFQVNSYTLDDQRFPRLNAGAGTRFVVVWDEWAGRLVEPASTASAWSFPPPSTSTATVRSRL